MSAATEPAKPVRPSSSPHLTLPSYPSAPRRPESPRPVYPRPAATGFARLLRRPGSRLALVALLTVNLAAVTACLLSYSRHGVGFGLYRIDLAAYRMGGQSWLHGEGLYGQAPVSRGLSLPFTYPPIAAALLAPLAVMAMTPAGTVLTLGSIALAALVLWVFLRRLALPGDRPGVA